MRKGSCIHCSHEGLKIVCALGLNPEDMARKACKKGEDYKYGLAYRIPCNSLDLVKQWFTKNGEMTEKDKELLAQKATCDKFTDPTNAQLKKHHRDIERFIAKMNKVGPLVRRIKKQHKGKSWRGVKKCPACGGKLHLSHASYNGHVWGKCETKGCVSWIE